MKRIFKTIPAALALIALTSCSNDDLFGSRSPEAAGLKTLDVTVEQLNDGTLSNATMRAANVGEGNALIWQNEDVITVYDDKLFLYDPYKFNGTSFVIADDKHIVETPQFAVFPNTYFKEGSTHYNRNEDKVFVTAKIDQAMNYGKKYDAGKTEGSSYVDYDGKAAYVSLLPMWGTAKDEDSKVAVNLKYMTAILKVTLTNAMGNVKYLHVRAYQDIAHSKAAQLNGEFTADLSSSGRTPLASTKLVPTMTDAELTAATAPNVLDIDIQNINKATSIIYVPIPATHYGLVQVWADGNPKATKDWATLGDAKIYEFVDKTFEVKFYGSLTKKVYAVDGSSVAKLNALLKANASESGDELVLDCSANATDASIDNVITVPAMAAANVELKLKDITNAAATIAGDDFTGKLILNLTTATDGSALTINLPNADVVLKGKIGNTRNITFANAKTVTFGDGIAPEDLATVPTTDYNKATITLNAEVQGEVKVAKYAKVKDLALAVNHRSAALTVEGEAGNLTVNAAANVKATTVTVTGKSGNITANNDESTVTVSGEAGAVSTAQGAVTISGNATDITTTTGKVTISGNPCYTTTNYTKVNNVTTTGGDVEVSLTDGKEGRAIDTKLTFNKSANLALNNGYIAAIDVKGGTAAAKTIVKVTNGTGGWTSLGTVTKSSDNDLLYITNASTWNGKLSGAGVPDAPAGATWAKADVQGSYNIAPANVYTATEFVQAYAGKSASTHVICNSINLGGTTAITPATALTGVMGGNKNFNEAGKYPTISGIKIATAPTSTVEESDGFGFFKAATASAAIRISNLTFDGISVVIAKGTKKGAYTPGALSNVGALIGKVTTGSETVDVRNVTIKNATVSVAGLASNVGGVVGHVTGSGAGVVTFENVAVESSAITGYKALGGIVGTIDNGNKVTFAKSATAPIYNKVNGLTFTQTTDPTKTACDAELAEVGDFIGYTTNQTAANLVINVASIPTTPAYTISNASVVNDLAKWPITSGSGVQMKDIVKGQYIIGFSNNTTTTVANFAIAGAAAVTYQAQGILTAAPTTGVKYLDYVKNF